MSAQFVAHVLSYSLGKGNLSLKGRRKRPWLEISRSEIERVYLGHQLKLLRRLHDGPVDAVWDRIATDGFYDKERFRLHGEDLWRAYELLCPHDKRAISQKSLQIAGLRGVASLWLDQGRFIGKRGSIRGRYSENEYEAIASWLTEFNIPAVVHRNNVSIIEISIKKDAIDDFLNLIRPLVHVSMKKKLRRNLIKFR